jgi:uncharacterized protein YbbC (DUF1343 family)
MILRSVLALACSLSAAACASRPVRTGLDVLISDSSHVLRGKRVGLITNHTGRDREGRRNIDLLYRSADIKLVALYGPEHGLGGVAAAGEKVGFTTDTATGLPIYSLYGDTRVPTPEMVKDVDVLLYDIQDVGARVYTYEWTMALTAEAIGKLGKQLIVLDRPDPIRADRVEGNILELPHRSFVGQYDVALQYGMTPAELLRFLVGTNRISANIGVIPMQNYTRAMWYSETGLPWVNPSPNIRDLEAATLYPGTVFFEGTNLSEGRGTNAPFKQVGAPWLTDAADIAAELNAMRLPGVRFDNGSTAVEAGQKHGGLTIPVLRVHVTERDAVEAVSVGIHMLQAIRKHHPADWQWRPSIERLAGTAELRAAVDAGDVGPLIEKWKREAAQFQQSTRAYWLYK